MHHAGRNKAKGRNCRGGKVKNPNKNSSVNKEKKNIERGNSRIANESPLRRGKKSKKSPSHRNGNESAGKRFKGEKQKTRGKKKFV